MSPSCFHTADPLHSRVVPIECNKDAERLDRVEEMLKRLTEKTDTPLKQLRDTPGPTTSEKPGRPQAGQKR
jgi:hypothetical protein